MRVKTLKALSLMISEIETLLQFSCPKVNELIINLSQKQSFESLRFLSDCAHDLLQNEDFPIAWKASLKENRLKLFLKQDEFNSLLSFGESLGTTALEGQISLCKVHKRIIDENLENARKSSLKYSKIFAPLGLLLGAAAAVMII